MIGSLIIVALRNGRPIGDISGSGPNGRYPLTLDIRNRQVSDDLGPAMRKFSCELAFGKAKPFPISDSKSGKLVTLGSSQRRFAR